MKKQKSLLIILLIAVLAVAWIVVLRTYLNVDEKREQSEHIAAGDTYREQELYVRAIPEYEAAAAIDTGEAKRIEIEEKLLDCYLSYGDYGSYISLVNKRIAAGTVTEAEYLAVAEYYLDNHSTDDALEILAEGRADFPESARMAELYEANRFSYRSRLTSYTEIVPTDWSGYAPAFDGEQWVYIGSGGRLAMNVGFAAATPYTVSSGARYAGVKIDDEWYIITTDGSWYGRDNVGLDEIAFMSSGRAVGVKNGKYGYYSLDLELLSESFVFDRITANACGVAAVENGGKWAVITDGGEYVTDFELEDVAIGSLGAAYAGDVAMVKRGGQWVMIDTEGNQVIEGGFSDAKAPESESGYIAVADASGKWGFIDRSGNLVIDYQYDDAFSFSCGLAAVYDGSEWKYISDKNETVIDEGYREAYPFKNGYAVAYILDVASIIELDYKEE